MIPALLSQIGIPVLTGILADVFKDIDTPVTNGAARALEEVDKAIQRGQISDADVLEANRHVESMTQMRLEQDAAKLSEINQSLRAEIVSEDQYVRRMRPTFGYFMAVTWAAQMMGIAYVIVFDTERSGEVLNAMSSLSAIWAVGLSVLGIYVYKRSEDKKSSKAL
ncbi:MAG: ribokinase [Alphaproteobacteria bacterium]|nr:ribokinase [Alphaproteobacteria bacterium]